MYARTGDRHEIQCFRVPDMISADHVSQQKNRQTVTHANLQQRAVNQYMYAIFLCIYDI